MKQSQFNYVSLALILISLFPFSTNGTDWECWLRETLRD